MARKSKYTAAAILAILDEANTSTVRAVCRRHGFAEKTFYRWRARFSPASKVPAPDRDRSDVTLQPAPATRLAAAPTAWESDLVRKLEDENRRLKELVAELSLENRALRASATGVVRTGRPPVRLLPASSGRR
jgi:putative transposase